MAFLFIKNYAVPILYMPVPQSGHFAFIAGLPFFMVTFSGLATSFLALHFTQYIVAIVLFHLPSCYQNLNSHAKLELILAK